MPPMPQGWRISYQPAVYINDRESILAWLAWNDSNSSFDDESMVADGFEPLTLDELQDELAREIVEGMTGEQVDNEDWKASAKVIDTKNALIAGKFAWPPEPPKLRQRIYVRHEYMQHSGIRWRVTYVAKVNIDCDWAAYICASTEDVGEAWAVRMCLTHGNKLSESVARSIFQYIGESYRR
jgi:hypothetical protein